MRHFTVLATGAALAALVTTSAVAHAHLDKSSPAANATVAAPKEISLTFSEAVEPRFSGFDLTTPDGRKTTVPVTASGDRKTITGKPARALGVGAHKVVWHAAGKDGHRMEGSYTFTVR